MAKVNIKFEKITPFGGFFHVRRLFSRYMGPVIDNVPAKWIRTARRYELNIYTDNKSYLNPFALADG